MANPPTDPAIHIHTEDITPMKEHKWNHIADKRVLN